jgi:hypothetical protein
MDYVSVAEKERLRICSVCGSGWLYTYENERKLRAHFGKQYNEPKRCPACLAEKQRAFAIRAGI